MPEGRGVRFPCELQAAVSCLLWVLGTELSLCKTMLWDMCTVCEDALL